MAADLAAERLSRGAPIAVRPRLPSSRSMSSSAAVGPRPSRFSSRPSPHRSRSVAALTNRHRGAPSRIRSSSSRATRTSSSTTSARGSARYSASWAGVGAKTMSLSYTDSKTTAGRRRRVARRRRRTRPPRARGGRRGARRGEAARSCRSRLARDLDRDALRAQRRRPRRRPRVPDAKSHGGGAEPGPSACESPVAHPAPCRSLGRRGRPGSGRCARRSRPAR